MNALYHFAIIEGYLAHHQQLPSNVQDAIEYLKETALKPAENTNQKRKKRRLSKETRAKMNAALVRGREVMRQKRASAQAQAAA